MTANGLKDLDVSERLRISRSQVSRLRRAKCTPTIETAIRLAELTKIPPEVFIFGERK